MIYASKKYKVNIAYDIVGSGGWIIMLHGWGSNKEVFKSLAQTLNCKCLLIDIPPFGKSDTLHQEWTIPIYADLINKMLDDLDVHNPIIIAHSFGGRIAIEITYKHQRTRKLILTGSAGVSQKSFKTKFKIMAHKLKNILCLHTHSSQKKGSADYQLLVPNMKKTFQNIVNHNQTSQLKFINCPTLIIWGENDNETPITDAKRLNKKIKNSTLLILKSCGHFCFIEQPVLFSKIVYNYLNEGD